jgi:hypothetical protein
MGGHAKAMPTHQQQLQAEPNRPVTLADQGVAALIGPLAVVEGEVLSGQASSHLVGRLSTRLARDRLLAAGAGEQGLLRALAEVNQRLPGRPRRIQPGAL